MRKVSAAEVPAYTNRLRARERTRAQRSLCTSESAIRQCVCICASTSPRGSRAQERSGGGCTHSAPRGPAPMGPWRGRRPGGRRFGPMVGPTSALLEAVNPREHCSEHLAAERTRSSTRAGLRRLGLGRALGRLRRHEREHAQHRHGTTSCDAARRHDWVGGDSARAPHTGAARAPQLGGGPPCEAARRGRTLPARHPLQWIW